MALSSQGRTQTGAAAPGSPSAGQVECAASSLCGADDAYLLEDRVAARSSPFAGTRVVDLAPAAIAARLGARRASSPYGLPETRVTSRPGDEDRLVIGRPPDDAADRRLPRERAVAIPNGRLERVRELVAEGPASDRNKRCFRAPGNADRPCAATGPITAGERDLDDPHAASLELRPHGRAGNLARPRTKPRGVDRRRRLSARRAASLARKGLACRASALHPPARDVQPRRRQEPAGGAIAPEPTLAAAPSRRSMALRAPLLEPRLAIAHDRLRERDSRRHRRDLGLAGVRHTPGSNPTSLGAARPFRVHQDEFARIRAVSADDAGRAAFAGLLWTFVAGRDRLFRPRASLIRKRSQVRVLDRPLAGIQEFAAFEQFSRIWLLEDRHVGVFRGATMGPPAVTGERQSARGFRAAVASVLGGITAGTVVIGCLRVFLSVRGRFAGGWLPWGCGSVAR